LRGTKRWETEVEGEGGKDKPVVISADDGDDKRRCVLISFGGKNGGMMYWAGTRVTVIMGLSYWAVGTGNNNMAEIPTSGIITTVLLRYDSPG
jgi:hypothetical protein